MTDRDKFDLTPPPITERVNEVPNPAPAYMFSRIPVILRGNPMPHEIIEAQQSEQGQKFGVLILPEEEPTYFDGTVPEGGIVSHDWTGEAQHPDSKRAEFHLTDEDIDRIADVADEAGPDGAVQVRTDALIELVRRARGLREVNDAILSRVTDQEEHTHYTDRSRAICAGGDHDSAVMWDRDIERIKVRENQEHIAATYGVEHQDLDEKPSMIASGAWCAPTAQVYNWPPTDEEIEASRKARRKAKKARRKARRAQEQREAAISELSEMTTMAEEPINDRLRRAWLNGFREGVDRAASSVESWGRWDS